MLPVQPILCTPEEGFKGFANARDGRQRCEGSAIHTEQVWLMDQVATPLWTEKGNREMTQMHEQDREEARAGGVIGRAWNRKEGLRAAEKKTVKGKGAKQQKKKCFGGSEDLVKEQRAQ